MSERAKSEVTPTLADYRNEGGIGSVIECLKCRCSISIEQQSARSSRNIRITPKGLAILAARDRGDYKTLSTKEARSRAGRRQVEKINRERRNRKKPTGDSDR